MSSLSQEEIDRIATAVSSKIGETCQCKMTSEAQKEMGHFWGMLKDEGDGSISAGVESIRRVIHSDKMGRRWAETFVKAVLTFTAGAGAAAVIAGVITALRKAFFNQP